MRIHELSIEVGCGRDVIAAHLEAGLHILAQLCTSLGEQNICQVLVVLDL